MPDYPTHQIPGDLLLRIVPARGKRPLRVEYQQGDGTWYRAPLRALAKSYPVGSSPWPWLLAHGVTRPSPSGPSGPSIAASDRRRKPVQLTLSDAARAALDARATRAQTSRSAVVEAWLIGGER